MPRITGGDMESEAGIRLTVPPENARPGGATARRRGDRRQVYRPYGRIHTGADHPVARGRRRPGCPPATTSYVPGPSRAKQLAPLTG
ncbi:hypothetical protein GCM10009540_35050 [Streptomyces turgidiscabies]